MKSFIIYTGGETLPELLPAPPEGAFLIAADSGYALMRRLGLTPDLVIGDFDSLGAPPTGERVLRLPTHKDDTDTQAAVTYALREGADDITVLGGIGSRLDHTLANACLLEHIAAAGARGCLCNGRNRVRLLRGGDALTLCRGDYPFFSVIALDARIKGLSIRGSAYNLDGAVLSRAMQYAVSNEIHDPQATVSLSEGTALLIESRD